MTTDPYDQEQDDTFDQITRQLRTPISPAPARHPGGRAMTRDTRSAEDKRAQARQTLGCSSLIIAVALAVAVVTIAWRW